MLRCSASPQLLRARRYSVAPCYGSACLHISRSRRFISVSTSKVVVDATPTKAKAPGKESQAAPAQAASRINAAAQAIGGVSKVVLKRGKTALFRGGHPMVYSGAVDRVLGKPQPVAGDSVMVTDGAETPIGWGVFNPNSMFRVRYRDVITQQLVQACKMSSQPVWRQAKDMLKEEGIAVADADSIKHLENPAAAQVQVRENGVKFWVAPSTGQKTGFYADQRDSRMALRHLTRSRTVLDLCCYTGGFALNALAGGATHVTGIDSSAPALELAESNARLNGWEPTQHTFLKNDIAKYMQQQIAEGSMWDIVVLDPPKLAPNRKSLTRALAKYCKLNTLAMRVLRPGGLLMTCSCSGAVTLDDHFMPVLKEAARAARRHIRVLRTAGAGPDHPIDPAYPEGAYLKNVLLLVT